MNCLLTVKQNHFPAYIYTYFPLKPRHFRPFLSLPLIPHPHLLLIPLHNPLRPPIRLRPIPENRLPSLMHLHLVLRRPRNFLFESERVEDAFVEDLLGESAVVHLLVVVFETGPVVAEGGEAVGCYVVEYTSRTPRDLPPLPHAVEFPRAMCVRLALHVVVIERRAAGSDEETRAHERG